MIVVKFFSWLESLSSGAGSRPGILDVELAAILHHVAL